LICHFELNFADIEAQFAISFKSYFAEELEQLQSMAEDGLVEVGDANIRVGLAGRLLIRRICMTFDAYMKKPSTEIRYSKII
jgi:oxygen-independent coproporphyrinogen-3 oxidase